MTYLELYENAFSDLQFGNITLEEFNERVKPLNQEQTRWIPISEKLPEKNMACLVAVGKFNLTQMAMYSDLIGMIDHRIFYQGNVGYDDFEDITEYVKAWMPLPSSYQGEENG